MTPRPTIAVYSDAAGNGHLCVFIAQGNSYTFAHTHTPKWFTELNIQIYELETCATLLAITLVAQLSENATIILCVDNTGTQNALINGRADSPVVNQIVATFWQVEARKNITVWAERVDSPTNIADTPYRKFGTGEPTNPLTQQAKRLPLHKLFVEIIQTQEALKAAQYNLPLPKGEYKLAFPCS